MDKYLVIKKTKHKIKMETLCQFIFLVYIWSFSILVTDSFEAQFSQFTIIISGLLIVSKVFF